ncbi:DUF3862 domain-containing protein [Paenibacillus sp. JDR-2]|uniref:DUF3862 domain-containing protein n=1 Tax=Paenibacillus sp. (strain JDR-2) TaxID=324057 RepID=UPI000166A780|nr:DUF3862 domain-containing protein [Paenibacillus sp. JDR-2]ACT00355.1 hypothetical protein Pjdr2_1691 [Paenibacillus sp. JDR-2]
MKGLRMLIVAGLFALTAACGSNEEDSKDANAAESTPAATASANVSPEAPNTSGDNETVITKENYDKVKNGMSYEEVVKIIGSEGEIVTETGEKGDDMYGIAVLYENKGSSLSNATFIFLGDKLQSKSQYGLE